MMLYKGINTSEYAHTLRTVGEAKCPDCKDGIVRPYGINATKENASAFVCDTCKFHVRFDKKTNK